MFFSVAILSTVNPGSAKMVALEVTAVNVCVQQRARTKQSPLKLTTFASPHTAD